MLTYPLALLLPALLAVSAPDGRPATLGGGRPSVDQTDLDEVDRDELRSNREARRRRASVERCREAALEESEAAGLFGRVSQIDNVRQVGARFSIRGVFVADNQPRSRNRFRFLCISNPRDVEQFRFRDRLPLALPLDSNGSGPRSSR